MKKNLPAIKTRDYALKVAMITFGLGIILHFILLNGYTPKYNDPDPLFHLREIFSFATLESLVSTILFVIGCKILKKET